MAKSKRPVFATVPEYVKALGARQASSLRRVLALVRKTVPNATTVISYGIPALKLDRVFIYCAAFKNHIGVYPPVRDAKLRALLEPYANPKGNLSFPLDEPLPMLLIGRVAKCLSKQYARPAKRKPGKA